MIWKSTRPLLLIIYNDVVKPSCSGSIVWYDWIEIKLENFGIPTYNFILMTYQNFYWLFHALYRGKNESFMEGSFNFACSKIFWQLRYRTFLYMFNISILNFNWLKRIQSLNFFFSLDVFIHLIFTYIFYFSFTFVVVFFAYWFILY